MQKITLPKRPTQLPPTAALREYRLPNGKPVRVFIELHQSPFDENGDPIPADMLVVYAQGYEMTDAGDFAVAPNGYPSRTKRTAHTVQRSAIGDTKSLKPAWVRHAPASQTAITPDTMPPGSFTGDALPAAGTHEGQIAYVGGKFYEWTDGETERIARGKASDMQNIDNNSAVLSGLALD